MATIEDSAVNKRLRKEPLNEQIDFHGISITIEYHKGDQKPDKRDASLGIYDWGYTQYADYGFVNKTTSNEEGEGLDVFIGPNKDSTEAFMFPLMNRDDPTVLDEYKLLLGFDSAKEALAFAQMQYYSDMVGGLLRTSIEDIKQWAELSEPLADKLARNPSRVNNEDLDKSLKGQVILTVPIDEGFLRKQK